MRRRDFLAAAAASALPARAAGIGFSLNDATARAGIHFEHNSGAFGAKYLPETLGPGCAFLDYDGDGWLDILLINSMDWPGHGRNRSTLQLYRNNRNGTFTDVTRQAGLAVEMYGLGVAVGDYNNDGLPDLLVTAVGQNRLFQNTPQGHFIDVTEKAGLGGRSGFSTSALWFDYDRDGHLDLFVCNYVKWAPEHDVFCSVDGKRKSYCTPEAYHGATCWLFRNRGDGSFEDVTARSGVFDTSSKSLGVAMLDYDRDGWPDLAGGQRHAAEQALPQPARRNFRRCCRARGRGVQRRRKGAGRHGNRRGGYRPQRNAIHRHHQLRRRNDCALSAWPKRRVQGHRSREAELGRRRRTASGSDACSSMWTWTAISISSQLMDTSTRLRATFAPTAAMRRLRTCS